MTVGQQPFGFDRQPPPPVMNYRPKPPPIHPPNPKPDPPSKPVLRDYGHQPERVRVGHEYTMRVKVVGVDPTLGVVVIPLVDGEVISDEKYEHHLFVKEECLKWG